MITAQTTNRSSTLLALVVVMIAGAVAFAGPYTVTNTDDSGAGSLRWAIESANAHTGADRIEFNIDGDGPHTIYPSVDLPDITDSVIIDGYTQSGASPATASTAADLRIVLDGSELTDATGLVIRYDDTHDCVIRGLRIQTFRPGNGIELGGNHNSVEGNHIFGCTGAGVFIVGQHNTIGGVTSAQRNVINGGNIGIGVFPNCTHNLIQGNYVGTDAEGESDDGFDGGEGVGIGGSYNTVVGNLISGYEKGVAILWWQGEGNPIPEHNVVEGNQIGTDVYGSSWIPNGLGIWLSNALDTMVRGNLIAGNNVHGVQVDNSEGVLATGNTITQNSIYANGWLGINLYNEDDVTENDPGDADIGPNNLMNFPVLVSAMATPGQLIVKGMIDTPDPKAVTLEFFANSVPDDTGYGEGETFLGTDRPNAKGEFTATLPPVVPGMWISATATDADGNTSEFALCIEAKAPGKE